MRRAAFFLPLAGCARRCVYCDQRTITGLADAPSPDDVRRSLAGAAGPIELCYFGGSFARLDRELWRAYADVVRDLPAGSRLTFSTYPSDFAGQRGREVIEALRGLPIGTIELGAPTLDPAVLARCHRGDDPDAVLGAFALLRDEGFHLGAQMMIGLPGQSTASATRDLERIASLMPADAAWHLRIYPCLVLRGTELERMYDSGEHIPMSAEEAAIASGELMLRADELGMVTIRVGLHDSPSLARAVRAGPYHPALGELARASALARTLAILSKCGPWEVPKKNISLITGHAAFGARRLAALVGISAQDIHHRIIYI